MKRRNFPRPSLLNRLCRVAARATLPLVFGLSSATAIAGPPRDKVYMLVPDDYMTSTTWQVKVWQDSAADEGLQLVLVTDTQLLAAGSDAAARYAGLILPDSAHIKASDAVVAAVRQYANLGGKVMLVYDAGALLDNGFYAFGPSRFSDLAGVNYVNYSTLIDKVVGFGQVVGNKARLESLGFPPGKYGNYTPPTSLVATTYSTAFVPTSAADPGGTKVMADAVSKRWAKGIDDGSPNIRAKRPASLRTLLGLNSEPLGPVKYSNRVTAVGNFTDLLVLDSKSKRLPEHVSALLSSDLKKTYELALPAVIADDLLPQTLSGYGYGALSYFSFVTLGLDPAKPPLSGYVGTPYLTSPEHGLVAGLRSQGSGQVLFVNIPLGYHKAIGTDSAPIQGFLGHFARDIVGVASTSVQPRAVGGMIYNWHIDDGDDLLSDAKYLLDKSDTFERGPYSIHLTSGVDVINYGDGNGMNLAGDPRAKDLVFRLGNIGTKWTGKKGLPVKHALGSHGGWIHDCWGDQASKVTTIAAANSFYPYCGTPGSPALTLTGMLQKNFDAIENAVGFKVREYSSPVGNTPTWAVNWLESNKPDVVAMYLVADVGSAMVRSWRATSTDPTSPQSSRLTTRIWSSPVTPYGKYATWEEFSEYGVNLPYASQWLVDLQSFVVNNRTNRQFYNHPPGARGNKSPIDAMLDRSERLQAAGRFKFYTMSELADFSQRRVNTQLISSSGSGATTISASNPAGLDDLAWLLPKARFKQPSISGNATLSGDSMNWIVIAEGGTNLTFTAAEVSP